MTRVQYLTRVLRSHKPLCATPPAKLYEIAKDNEVGVLQVLINGEIQQEIPVYKAITPKVESQSWFDKLMNWFTGAVSF